jgi:cell division protein FtsB
MPPREEATRTEPGARRRAWVLGTAIAVVALAVGSLFGDRGMLTLFGKREQVAQLQDEIRTLREENAVLATEIAELRTSPRAIERLAREQLGLARPDEMVFLLRRAAAEPRPADRAGDAPRENP